MAKDKSVTEKEEKTAKKRSVKTVTEKETPLPSKGPDPELYNKVINVEEEEARKRDPDEDAQLYFDTCRTIANLLQEIAILKTKNDAKPTEAIREKQTQVTLKIMLLKRLNRLEKMRTIDYRQALQLFREQVDNDNLHLQNLLYEQLHLSKEVTKCYEFKSIDEDMDLVSVEEFFASAPESLTKNLKSEADPHALKLARLSWELMQRKDLSIKLKKLEAAKEAVAKEIEAKKDQLGNLGPNLKTILDAMKPLQDTLGINLDKLKKIPELALLLPKPLYILFVQAEAYSRLAKWLSVTISGKPEEVSSGPEHQFDDISSDDSDSDGDEPTRRRKALTQDRRKSSGSRIGENVEKRRLDCLKRHPLSIELKISHSKGESVTLQFQWLTTLEVVCVLPCVADTNISGLAASDLLSPTSVLSELQPGDTGEQSPNPSTHYHVQNTGIEFPTNISTLGIPYLWAQALCGVTFKPEETTMSSATSKQNFETVLSAIRNRLKSRMSLANELKQLESGEALKDKNLQSRLLSFTTVPALDLNRVPSASRLIDKKIIDSTFLGYRAVVDVHDVKVIGHIALSPSYPSVLPIFAVEVQKKKGCNAWNFDHIRDLEREMNTDANVEGDVLSQQMLKFMQRCEVLVSTEFPPDRPVKATFFKPVFGRARKHPYHFKSTAGGIFTHQV